MVNIRRGGVRLFSISPLRIRKLMTEITKKKNTEEPKTEITQLIEKAITSNVPVETLERLFALQKEYKADRAREAFVQAKAKFQSEVPVIKNDKRVLNKDGRTVRYQYSSLGYIAEQIKKPLANNGLAYSWDVVHENNHMRVAAKLTHSLGYSETSTFEIPVSQDQYMTEPQKYASAQTYAKRYTLINVLGLATADEDTDAVDVGKEKDVKSEKAKIIFFLRAIGLPNNTKEEIEEAVRKVAKLELIEKNYPEIIKRLQAEKEKFESEQNYDENA